jgi:hypothetical protein
MKIRLIALLFLIVALSACHRTDNNDPVETVIPDGTVNVAFHSLYEGQDFAEGTVYLSSLGYRIRVDDFRNYFSMVQLHRTDGALVDVKDFYLADFYRADPTLTATAPPGTYDSLFFNIGIPAAYNTGVDPSIYPSVHPLSVVSAQDMFWGWNAGYIFFKFDGKLDSTGVDTAELLEPFAFHCGDDPLFTAVHIPLQNATVMSNGNKTIDVDIHVDRILKSDQDTIDLATDYITHTSGNVELAQRIMRNYSRSFEAR